MKCMPSYESLRAFLENKNIANANPWFVELLKGLYFRTGLHPIKHQEISVWLARHGEHRLADLAVPLSRVAFLSYPEDPCMEYLPILTPKVI